MTGNVTAVSTHASALGSQYHTVVFKGQDGVWGVSNAYSVQVLEACGRNFISDSIETGPRVPLAENSRLVKPVSSKSEVEENTQFAYVYSRVNVDSSESGEGNMVSVKSHDPENWARPANPNKIHVAIIARARFIVYITLLFGRLFVFVA